MGIIKVINNDGRVEHISETEIKHRTDVRRMEVGEVPAPKPAVKAKEPIAAREPSIPELMRKVKETTTLEALDAIASNESRPQMLSMIQKQREALIAGEVKKDPPAAIKNSDGKKEAKPAVKKDTTKKAAVKA